MTNKDKFLRDGVSVEEFINELCKKKEYVFEDKEYGEITKTHDYEIYITDLVKWLNEQVAPILTEDEKVILRNIDTEAFEKIGRDETGHLYLWWEDNRYLFRGYNHLFQFIKERRRIRNKGVTK